MGLETIRKRLSGYPAKRIHEPEWRQAAVAMVLLPVEDDLQVLLIERALNEKDPWSGHLAMPGGRVESGDADSREAAERETMEEVGIKLLDAQYLGQLDDVVADGFPMVISCFVYALSSEPTCKLESAEVADAFWISLSTLDDPHRKIHIDHPVKETNARFPAIRLTEKPQPLWGITYKILKNFQQVSSIA